MAGIARRLAPLLVFSWKLEIGAAIRVEDLVDGAMADVELEEDKASDQLAAADRGREEECAAAVDGAGARQRPRWRRRKCDCGEGMVPMCPGDEEGQNVCGKQDRFFRASLFAEREDCLCTECKTAKVCTVVLGGERRPAVAVVGKVRHGGCRCPEGAQVTGEDEACKGNSRQQRFYRPAALMGKDCSCRAPDTGEGNGEDDDQDEQDDVVTPPPAGDSSSEDPTDPVTEDLVKDPDGADEPVLDPRQNKNETDDDGFAGLPCKDVKQLVAFCLAAVLLVAGMAMVVKSRQEDDGEAADSGQDSAS